MKINLKINDKELSFSEKELREQLNIVVNKGLRGKLKAEKILNKLNHNLNLTNEDIQDITEMFFLHNKDIRLKMVDEGYWFKIGNMSEAENEKRNLEKKAMSYGNHRYKKDYGWLGVYAEEKVKELFRDNFNISFEEWTTNEKEINSNSWVDKIDNYDIKISDKTIDVKCATQPHYIEITPKVNVENKIPKDIYIATKFFNDNNLYLIGFFYHEDIKKCHISQKYGAEYYQVKLYNAKCLDKLKL